MCLVMQARTRAKGQPLHAELEEHLQKLHARLAPSVVRFLSAKKTGSGFSGGGTYATGGYAYGNVKTKMTTLFAGTTTSVELSNTRGGWTVGGGIETPFTFLVSVLGNNWTSKTEYLYVDLGTSTGAFTFTSLGVPVTATNTTQVHEHIFRTGLNYHFNSPVVAKY